MFYGGEENQGGSPNRGESVPFNETVNLIRATGVSTFVGISDPTCLGTDGTNCNYMPSGLKSGFPTNVFTLPAPVSFRGVDTNFRNPLVDKWNFVVQRELPGQTAMEVEYTGNHQAHQVILWNSDICNNIPSTTVTSCTQQFWPIPYVESGLSTTSSFGFGNYDALNVVFEKRYSRGLQFHAAYSWSHAMADSATPLSGSSNIGTPSPRNFASEYSSASWDIRHNFTFAFNYDIPFGRGRSYGANMNKAFDTIAGNWHMNGILTLRTGVPYTIAYNGCQGYWGRCEPDLVSGASPNAAPSGGRTPGQWFNTANFVPPAPLTGGDLGLQTQTGPPTRTMDFSLFKDFPITERFRVQFRGEAINIANTPQFNIPDASLQDAAFGKITSTQAASERHIQFALRFSF